MPPRQCRNAAGSDAGRDWDRAPWKTTLMSASILNRRFHRSTAKSLSWKNLSFNRARRPRFRIALASGRTADRIVLLMRNPRSRTALGRNLGSLLGRPGNSPVREPPSPSHQPLSPGVSALVRGANPNQIPSDSDQGHPPRPDSQPPQANHPGTLQRSLPRAGPKTQTKRLIQSSLLLADLLLILLATRLAFGGDIHLGAWGLALCAVAILFGAWLTWVAFRLE